MSFLRSRLNSLLGGSQESEATGLFEQSKSARHHSLSSTWRDSGFFSASSLRSKSPDKSLLQHASRNAGSEHQDTSTSSGTFAFGVSSNSPPRSLHKAASTTIKMVSETLRSKAQLFYVASSKSGSSNPYEGRSPSKRESKPRLLSSLRNRHSRTVKLEQEEEEVFLEPVVYPDIPHELHVDIPDAALIEPSSRNTALWRSSGSESQTSRPQKPILTPQPVRPVDLDHVVRRGVEMPIDTESSDDKAESERPSPASSTNICHPSTMLPDFMRVSVGGSLFVKGLRNHGRSSGTPSPYRKALLQRETPEATYQAMAPHASPNNGISHPSQADGGSDSELMEHPNMGQKALWDETRAYRQKRYEVVRNMSAETASDTTEAPELQLRSFQGNTWLKGWAPEKPLETASSVDTTLKTEDNYKEATAADLSVQQGEFEQAVEASERRSGSTLDNESGIQQGQPTISTIVDAPSEVCHDAVVSSGSEGPCRGNETNRKNISLLPSGSQKYSGSQTSTHQCIRQASTRTSAAAEAHSHQSTLEKNDEGTFVRNAKNQPVESNGLLPSTTHRMRSMLVRAVSSQSTCTTESCAITTHSPVCYDPVPTSSFHTRKMPARRTSSIIDELNHQAVEESRQSEMSMIEKPMVEMRRLSTEVEPCGPLKEKLNMDFIAWDFDPVEDYGTMDRLLKPDPTLMNEAHAILEKLVELPTRANSRVEDLDSQNFLDTPNDLGTMEARSYIDILEDLPALPVSVGTPYHLDHHDTHVSPSMPGTFPDESHHNHFQGMTKPIGRLSAIIAKSLRESQDHSPSPLMCEADHYLTQAYSQVPFATTGVDSSDEDDEPFQTPSSSPLKRCLTLKKQLRVKRDIIRKVSPNCTEVEKISNATDETVNYTNLETEKTFVAARLPLFGSNDTQASSNTWSLSEKHDGDSSSRNCTNLSRNISSDPLVASEKKLQTSSSKKGVWWTRGKENIEQSGSPLLFKSMDETDPDGLYTILLAEVQSVDTETEEMEARTETMEDADRDGEVSSAQQDPKKEWQQLVPVGQSSAETTNSTSEEASRKNESKIPLSSAHASPSRSPFRSPLHSPGRKRSGKKTKPNWTPVKSRRW